MNRPLLPYKMLDLLSDSIAVVDDKQQVIYANQAFDRLYNPFQDSSKKTPCWELKDLILRFQKSKKRFVSENVLIPPIGKKFEVFAFSLNNSGVARSFNLVLVKMGDQPAVPEFILAEELVNAYINERRLISEPLAPEFKALKGEDINFRLALLNAQKAARSDLPIILKGESGTGKEILASTIHNISPCSQGPFVDINCAAIPDTLIESELFGYERGAFTGARGEGKKGLFEEADHGTIFLDEIGDTSLSAQSKILRVLEEKRFRRVGGSKNIKVDVRIISATNKDLEKMISDGHFRDDLYYRLNTISIILPPLRDRGRDIRLLANFFLGKQTRGGQRKISFSEEAFKVLESYNWPGNVRELKGVVDYAVTISDETGITPQSLPPFVFLKKSPLSSDELLSREIISIENRTPLLSTIMKEVERNLIKLAIRKSGSKSEAIRTLGISRRAFYYKLKEYNLEFLFK
jgi:transcriptional regulator with PAS, ATPase and Fis domain